MIAQGRQSGEVVAGRYALERRLGEGAFGEVWSATDGRAFGRRVAVKFLLERHLTNPEVVQRFWREGQATAALSHPNVVGLLEFGEDGGVPFLVSEFVEGEPLRAVLDRAADGSVPLPVDEALAIFRQACAGVIAAHAKAIVHRDLKPENIMVHGRGVASVMVKVLDFGVARILGKDSSQSLGRTETGKIIGSLQYMAPEQVLGDVPSIDQRTDQFALAAVLFELFALRPAFAGEGYHEVVGAILDPKRPALAPLRADVGPALDPVLARAFSMRRDERYEDLRALLTSVDDALSRRPHALAGKSATVSVPDLSGQWAAPPPPRPQPANPPHREEHLRADRRARSRVRGALLVLGVALSVGALGSAVAISVARSRMPPPTPAPLPLEPTALHAPRADDAAVAHPRWTAPPVDPDAWVLVSAPDAPFLLGAEPPGREGASAAGALSRAAGVTFAGPSFRIMKTEVTFGHFEAWAEAFPEHRPLVPPWVPSAAEARAALPAVNVPWSAAEAYCRSIDAALPSEEQWEYAARGTAGRLAPWDGALPPGVPAFLGPTGRLLAAGSFAQDATAAGVLGMAANGQEWTSSVYRNDDGSRSEWQQGYRTVRGLPLREAIPTGAPPAPFLYRNAGCAVSTCGPAERLLLEHVGFRCVKPAT
jgi:serine/threonine protein kinase/formylglycine-generating enzyme required for sulfatase activity